MSGPRSWPGRVVCVTDPEARHIHKNKARHENGFRARVSFEPEAGLFTAVELTGGAARPATRPPSRPACWPASRIR